MLSLLVYFVSNIVSSGVPFLLSIVLARFLPVPEFGQIALYTTQISLAGIWVGFSAYASVQARLFLDPDRFPSYLSSSVMFHLLGLFGTLALLLILRTSFVSWASLPLWALCAAAVSAFFQCLLNMHLLLAQGKGWKTRYLILQLVQSIALLLLVPLFAIGLDMGWHGYVVGQVVQLLLVTPWNLFTLIRRFGLAWHVDWAYLKANFRFGMSLLPHNLAGFVTVGYDRIYVGAHAGADALGIYSIMLQFGMMISLVVSALNKVYTPWLYERLRNRSEWHRIAVSTWLGVLAVVVFCAVSLPLMSLAIVPLLGEKFQAGSDLLVWMVLGGMVNGIYLLVTNMIFFSERIWMLSIASVSGATVKWFLLPVLFASFGLSGAAASNLVGLSVTATLVTIFVVVIYDRRVLFGNSFSVLSRSRRV